MDEEKWKNHGTPKPLADAWRKWFGDVIAPPVVHTKGGELEAMVAREPIGPNREALEDPRWHISVRGPGRVPTWEEMVDAAHSLRPGVVFCVPVPPRTWWINVHEDVLHLWEIRDANLERQWRSEVQSSR